MSYSSMDYSTEDSETDYHLMRAASPPESSPSLYPPPPRASTRTTSIEELISPSVSRGPAFDDPRAEYVSATDHSSSTDLSSASDTADDDTTTINDHAGPFRTSVSNIYSRVLVEEFFTIEEIREEDLDVNAEGDDESRMELEVLRGVCEDSIGGAAQKRRSHAWRSNDHLLSELGALLKTQSAESSDAEDFAEQKRAFRRKSQRWSIGSNKRAHGESAGSGTDADDSPLDSHEGASTMRRLRRRLSKSTHTTSNSLIINDYPSMVNVKEVDEGDMTEPADFIADEMPFWTMSVNMVVDSETEP